MARDSRFSNPTTIVKLHVCVSAYASEMMKEESLSKIFNALQDMKEAVRQKDFRRWHNVNKKLHFAIVETTRNYSLIQYVKSLLNVFTESDFGVELRKHYLTEKKYVEESIEVHEAIYQRLRDGNKEKLRDHGNDFSIAPLLPLPHSVFMLTPAFVG